jgi:hypothetical protein
MAMDNDGDGSPPGAQQPEPQAQSGEVAADMWFLSRLDLYKSTKPYMITFDTTDFPGPKTNHEYAKHSVMVNDARPSMRSWSLGTHGFEFRDWSSGLVGDMFDDDELVEKLYYPEVIRHARAAFPQFERVHVFAHLVCVCPILN